MAKVLLVGYIAELLQERERTLLAAGYEVIVAQSFATASTIVAQKLFDVAVLGFSVPENERNQLARGIKQANPSAKIIMIYFDSIKNTELADAHHTDHRRPRRNTARRPPQSYFAERVAGQADHAAGHRLSLERFWERFFELLYPHNRVEQAFMPAVLDCNIGWLQPLR